MTEGTLARLPVFILSAGTVGDIYPLLRIGRALKQRGHAVTFIGPQIHSHHVEGAGLPFHSIFSTAEHLALMNNPDIWHPRKGLALIMSGMREGSARMTDIMALLPGDEACVMLAHPLTTPAAAIARTQRPQMRIVTFYLAPSNLRSVHDPLTMGELKIARWVPHGLRRLLWRLADKLVIDPTALPGLNALRTGHGLPPVEHFMEHVYATADLSLTLFPEWFAPTPPDWPRPLHQGYFQRYDPLQGQALPEPLRNFLDRGERPIVFTPGSGNLHAHEYFLQAQKAVAALKKRAIFLTPYREQVPQHLPESIHWQDYVPLSSVLPHVAALVHHGGIGTTAEALRAGVPQLVVPLAYDQFDNAARVSALGVGSSLPIRALQRGALVHTLAGVLESPGIERRCREVAERFATLDDEEALCRAIIDPDRTL